MACNYDSTAVWQPEETVTSGLLGISVGGGSWDSEISWQILDAQGELILEGYAPFAGEIVISSGVYELVLLDSYGDGWNGADMTLETSGGVQVFTLESGSLGTFTFEPAFGNVCEYQAKNGSIATTSAWLIPTRMGFVTNSIRALGRLIKMWCLCRTRGRVRMRL